MLKQISEQRKGISLIGTKKIDIYLEVPKRRLNQLENQLCELIGNRKKKIILNHISEISDESMIMNNTKMWQFKRNFCPKQLEKPSAKLNKNGEFVTDRSKLRELYVKTYEERLRLRVTRKVKSKD